MIKDIIQIGDERLLIPSVEIAREKIDSKETRNLANDLVDTIKAHEDSAAGLSAVQIGVMLRMFVIKVENEETDVINYITIINPEIVDQSSETSIIWEGCMSINSKNKRLYGPVSRAKYVKINYYDLEGEFKTIEGEDFMSHLLLHEIDHLNGKLFLQYIDNPENLWDEDSLDEYIDKNDKFPPII